ncbi:hypothetical protein Tco_0158557 [Tanacetum coccineum]
MKAFRAKTEVVNHIRGDHILQYAMLRDYLIELKANNPNTTVNIKPTSSKKKKYASQILTKAKYMKFNLMARHFKDLKEQFMKQQKKMDEFIAFKVPYAVIESVSAHVINELKNKVPILISLTITPQLSITNITIPKLKEQLLDIMSYNPYFIEGKINIDHYNALLNYMQQDRITARKYLCKEANLRKRPCDDQDLQENREREENKTRKQGDWFTHVKYKDYESTDKTTSVVDLFNEIVDVRKYPEGGEISQNDSTFAFAKRLKRCLNVNKLTKEDIQQSRKDGYEQFGNHVMSKAQCEYNMGKITLVMLDDMDWFLTCITVVRAGEEECAFKEYDYHRLNLNDIKDMYVLKAQGKLHHLGVKAEYDLANSLLLYSRSIVIKKRVEYIQLSVESYQSSLNRTEPEFIIPSISIYPTHTMFPRTFGVIYEDKSRFTQFMGIHEVF